ncbi:MAG TPA: FAD binding domain-containing protein [Anaerolineales bacterium]|nr:FAD binding domain-containing protein [Anaerolineales bacterium]
MPSLKYFRPKTIDEALALLEQGVPLAGGTALTPRRLRLEAVVDLQDLGMAVLERNGDLLEVGSGCTLQQLVEADSLIPPALAAACRAEAAWNLRNMATLGGTVVAADGRSPLLAAVVALGAEVHGLPRDEWKSVEAYLETRGAESGHRLLTRFRWPAESRLRSAQVGRSPADRPLVLAALGRAPSGEWRVVLGGHGPRPIRVPDAEAALSQGDVTAAVRKAEQAYAEAGDAFASAEYRSQVAGVLLRRLAAEEKVSSEAREKA